MRDLNSGYVGLCCINFDYSLMEMQYAFNTLKRVKFDRYPDLGTGSCNFVLFMVNANIFPPAQTEITLMITSVLFFSNFGNLQSHRRKNVSNIYRQQIQNHIQVDKNLGKR